MNKWCEKEIGEMVDAIAKCKNSGDVCAVFDVILTPREINDMARRYKIIQYLDEGKCYSEISGMLGVSSAMISRVAGKIGFGFRRVHATIAKKSVDGQWKDPLQRKRDVYYKGVPSIGTIIKHAKR